MGTEGDDDTDTQGVGLSSRRNPRFANDSLYFTGTDLGDRSTGVVRRKLSSQNSDDDEGEGEDDEDDGESLSSDGEEDEDDEYPGRYGQLALMDREETLVQSALRRIAKAQAKGKADVKLNRDELGALERMKAREREAERMQRMERKKRKEQRVAIPLSQLESVGRKKKSAHSSQQGTPPRRSSATDSPEGAERQVYPPMGYFPPPSASRSRPRSGTSSSQRPPSRSRDDVHSSPFNYEIVQRPPSAQRNGADPVSRPHSVRGMRPEDSWPPNSQSNSDPFVYQTAGPRAQPPSSVASSSRRYRQGPVESTYKTHRAAPSSVSSRGRRNSRLPSPDAETSAASETSEESTSDDLNHGAQIVQPARGREEIVVEVSPEPEPVPGPVKKKSSSPAKRKSTGSTGKRKKK